MKTSRNRLNITDLPDVFGPQELARFLGVQQATGYELVKRKDFPSIKLGVKYLIYKNSFLDWLKEQEMQKDAI